MGLCVHLLGGGGCISVWSSVAYLLGHLLSLASIPKVFVSLSLCAEDGGQDKGTSHPDPRWGKET